MASALERFRQIRQNQEPDNSPVSPQKVPGDEAADLSGAIVPIVRAPVGDDEVEERAAIIEYDSAIPRTWALGYALLLGASRPEWMSAEQWQAHLDAAGRLLACWGAQMDRLGWSVPEVLGVDPRWPGTPWKPCLLSALVGVSVGALTQDRISITFADGGSRSLERGSGGWVYS